MLTVARLDELKFGSVHLRSWLAQRIEALRERAEQGSVSLTGEAPDVEWRFDARRMARALDNLILNSLQHTPPAGWVKVTIDAHGSVCHMIVEDSGPGIPPEQRETIFEPLYTTRSEGVGLGLGIAREIVEAHGGTLRCVDSPVCARFEIELPCQKS